MEEMGHGNNRQSEHDGLADAEPLAKMLQACKNAIQLNTNE
jgi:hypothetical protein